MPSALQTIQTLLPDFRPRIAVVLGSGWGVLTDHLLEPVRIPYAQLEGFPQASVSGHAGELCLGQIGPYPVAVLSGRQHAYETGAVDGMKVPLRTLRALGCEVLVQTNSAGSLSNGMPSGSLMALSDHINFVQRSPLVGEGGSDRFVSLQDAYDADLRAQARRIAQQRHIHLYEGVYGWCLGPQFETPAEIRMLAQLGCQAVGMSTVPETILARHCGMRVLAISLITNMAAGLSTEPMSHLHTLAQAQRAAAQAGGLLAGIIANLAWEEGAAP